MIDELLSLGFSEGEIKVYVTLLKLGEATNGPIAKHTGQQVSTVYYCLNSLLEKGFVSYATRGNRKYFQAVQPEHLRTYLEEQTKALENKRQRIEKLIPELKAQQHALKDKTTVEIFEGFNGFRAVLRQLSNDLHRGDSYEAFVIEQSTDEPEKLKLFFMEHNKTLKERGITTRLLAPERLRKPFEYIYGKAFLKKYQVFRYTKEKIPIALTLYKDFTITHITQDEFISIKVKNRRMTQTYRDYFNEVWERSTP